MSNALSEFLQGRYGGFLQNPRGFGRNSRVHNLVTESRIGASCWDVPDVIVSEAEKQRDSELRLRPDRLTHIVESFAGKGDQGDIAKPYYDELDGEFLLCFVQTRVILLDARE